MKKLFLLALLAVAFQLSAQPLWMHHNVISPQGDKTTCSVPVRWR